MHGSCRPLAILMALAMTLPAAAQAPDPLTLDEALALSLDGQPALTAYDRTATAVQEAAVAARQLPDPRLSVGIRNFPVIGEGAFSFGSAMMTMKTIGVSRNQVRGARRTAAADRLLAQADLSLAEQQLLARRIQREVLLGWTTVLEAQLRQRVLRDLLERLEGRREAVEAAIPTGRSALADSVAIRAEAAAVAADLEGSRGAEAAGRAALMRWIGDAAERPLSGGLAICPPPEREQVMMFLDRHPALEAARRENAVAERAIAVARADRKPNWGWSVMYGQRDNFSDLVSLEVSIDLPLNRSRLQNRRIAEASELAAAARDRVEDRRRELMSEYQRALAQWTAAMARLRTTETRTLPALQAAESALQARLEGGSQELQTILAARERTTRTALELVEQQGAVARISADLLFYIEECAE